MKKLGVLGILGVVVGGLLVAGIALYFYASSLKTQGVHLETELSRQYQSNQAEYSAYAATVTESLGVAETKFDKIKELIEAYVSGRKVEGSGKLAVAVQEAVPDLKSAEIYDKIVEAIQKGREQFKNKQDALLSSVKRYEDFQNAGLLRPIFLRVMGFPTNNLRATIGGNSVYGQSALDQMRKIVTTLETQKAFETGTDDPIVKPRNKQNGK